MIIHIKNQTFDHARESVNPALVYGYEPSAIAHYFLGSANTLRDLTGNQADLVAAANEPTLSTHYAICSARNLSATGYDTGIVPALDQTIFAIVGLPASGTEAPILSNYDTNSTGVYMRLDTSSSPARLRVSAIAGGGSFLARVSAPYSNGIWTMAGMSVSATQKRTFAPLEDGLFTAATLDGSFSVASTSTIHIGGHKMVTAITAIDQFYIAELIVFDSIVTATAAQAVYDAAKIRMAARGITLP